jgi:uncharacterized membrane protein YqjE
MTSYETPPTTAQTGATGLNGAPGTDTGESRSIGDIVGAITRDLSTLVKQELELAKTEMKQEATKAGKGAGLLGGAGVAGHLFLIFFSLFAMFLLSRVMDYDWAALIVAAVWGIVAAVLAMRGKKELQQVNPSLETTQRTLKEDVRWAKEQKNS